MSSLSQALLLEYLPSSHSAFQDHAAHIVEWSTMLRPNGSWGTCIPQGMIHSLNALHGAPFEFPIRPHVLQVPECTLGLRAVCEPKSREVKVDALS